MYDNDYPDNDDDDKDDHPMTMMMKMKMRMIWMQITKSVVTCESMMPI